MIKRIVILIFLFWYIVFNCQAIGPMTQFISPMVDSCSYNTQDFTTYTETDPGNDITVDSASKISWVDMINNVQGMVTKDFTADYFSGDFTFRFTLYWTNEANFSAAIFWAVAKKATGIKVIEGGSAEDDDAIVLYMYNPSAVDGLYLKTVNDGSVTTDSYTGADDGNVYYITITRDDDAGANSTGQTKAYICTTGYCTSGGNLQDTLSVDQPAGEQNDYRYVYGVDSNNNSQPNDSDGYTENMEFKLCL